MAWNAICCAVDFEASSRAAMDEAAELAKRLGAALTLVHAVAPAAPAAREVIVTSRDAAALADESAARRLEAWRAEAEQRSGGPVRTALLRGDPATELLRHARGAAYDVIFVGTHGRSGLPRLLVGSVAERVARESGCPVVVVHETERRAREALAEELAQYH